MMSTVLRRQAERGTGRTDLTDEEVHQYARRQRIKYFKGVTFKRLPKKDYCKPAGKIHIWTTPNQTFCHCGRFDRDDSRLEEVTPGEHPNALTCGNCSWDSRGEQEYLRTGKTS